MFQGKEKSCLEWHEGKKMASLSFLNELCSYVFFLGGTEITDGSCEKQGCHTGFKAEGWHSLVGSLGWLCVMVVLVPLRPLSVPPWEHSCSDMQPPYACSSGEPHTISTANQSHLELSPNFPAQLMSWDHESWCHGKQQLQHSSKIVSKIAALNDGRLAQKNKNKNNLRKKIENKVSIYYKNKAE